MVVFAKCERNRKMEVSAFLASVKGLSDDAKTKLREYDMETLEVIFNSKDVEKRLETFNVKNFKKIIDESTFHLRKGWFSLVALVMTSAG